MSVIVTGTVAEGVLDALVPVPDDELLLLLWATGLTCVIFPSEVLPSGSWTVTGSPTTASVCFVASRATVTTSWVEVVCRIAGAVPEPLAPDDEPLALEPPPPDAPPLDELPPPDAPPPPAPPPPLEAAPATEAPPPPPPTRPLAPAEPVAPPADRPPAPADGDEPLFFSSSVSACNSASNAARVVGVFAPGLPLADGLVLVVVPLPQLAGVVWVVLGVVVV